MRVVQNDVMPLSRRAVVGPSKGRSRRAGVLGGCALALVIVLGVQSLSVEVAAAAQRGDMFLVPYLTTNLGTGWTPAPDAPSASAMATLRTSLSHGVRKGTPLNIAEGQWSGERGAFGLSILLVSSPDLRTLAATPKDRVASTCASLGGTLAQGQIASVADVPNGVFGLCLLSGNPKTKFASLVAFSHGNVAVVVDVTSAITQPLSAPVVDSIARAQYLDLPATGVIVSSGQSWGLYLVWLALLGAVVYALVETVRRRRSWHAPWDAVRSAFVRRGLALGVALGVVVGAMAFSMLDYPVVHGLSGWLSAQFDDLWTSWNAAALSTVGGGYGHVYSFDPLLEAAPGWLAVTAPVARMAFGLSFSIQRILLHPTAWWVAGPLFIGAVTVPLCAVDRMLGVMEVTGRWRRISILAVAGITLVPIAFWGHSEDMVALGAVLYGLMAAVEGRHRAAGWWLGAALAFQLLAFLAVPLALVFLKRRQWITVLPIIVAVPLVTLIGPLLTSPHLVLHQVLHQQVYDFAGYIGPTWHLDPGVASGARLCVALASVPAALVMARFVPEDRRVAMNLVVWVLGVLFMLRVVEPEIVPYYLAPPLALLVLSAGGRPWWRLGAAGLLALFLTWWLHFALHGRWSSWLILVGQLVVLAALGFPPMRNPSSKEPAAAIPSGRRRAQSSGVARAAPTRARTTRTGAGTTTVARRRERG